MSPAIIMGGWMNMPGWVSRGLMPSPSAGVRARVAKGLAMNSITARKKVSTNISTEVV